MIRSQFKNIKSVKLLSVICGSLVLGLPFIPKLASAQVAEKPDYCLDGLYREPLNRLVVVPDGCPANAYTQALEVKEAEIQANTQPINIQPEANRQFNPSRPVGVIQPPMPAHQMRAMGSMNVEGNRVDVTLNNDTNARINYQVIGHTNDRLLYEGDGAELLNLPLPVTITAIREDNGLLDIQDMFPEDGQVEFVLQESDFSGSAITIQIEEDGTIFAF